MREHMGLFRGKRIDNGKWVEGSLLFDPDLGGTQIIGFEYWTSETGIERGGFCESVDPDTVGECTGLRDKNGKLIFENHKLKSDGEVYEVRMDRGEWRMFDKTDHYCELYIYAGNSEIVSEG